jgi:hypothetical protein
VELRGGNPLPFFKYGSKIAVVVKSHCAGNLVDGFFPGQQEGLGFVKPDLGKVIDKTLAVRCLNRRLK